MAEQIQPEVWLETDFDTEWIQEGAHWKYDRIFNLTFNALADFVNKFVNKEGENTFENTFEFFYRIQAEDKDGSIPELEFEYGYLTNYIEITDLVGIKKSYYKYYPEENANKQIFSWTYSLRLSDINKNTLDALSEKYISVLSCLRYPKSSTSTVPNAIYNKYTYYLDLPLNKIKPPIESATNSGKLFFDYIKDRPGEFKCSWSIPESSLSPESSLPVHGFIIEAYHCPVDDKDTDMDIKIPDDSAFNLIEGLVWDEEYEEENNRKKFTKEYNKNKYNKKFDNFNEDVITFLGPKHRDGYGKLDLALNEGLKEGSSTEYELYFRPRELGIEPGDFFKLHIYPYRVHSNYIEDNISTPGSRLSGTGNFTEKLPALKAFVRVLTKNENGETVWKLGQVWTMVERNKNKVWEPAEAIFVKEKDGWKLAESWNSFS